MGLRATRVLAGVVAVAVVAGCGATTGGSAHPPTPSPTSAPRISVTFNGFAVTAVPGTTVAALAAHLGMRTLDGRLLAVVSGRVLDPRADPAKVSVDGVTVGSQAVLADGDAVVVVAGHDRTEATQTVTVTLSADPTGTGLYVGGTPGAARVVRGAVSGERVSYDVLSEPVLGRLREPGPLALTFDDGPDPVSTPEILALLAQYHVPATFCLIGREARAHPDLVRAEARAGHALCDHTQNHDLALPGRPAATVTAEVDDGYASVVAASGGVKPVYFRAPGGNWSPAIEAAARARQLSLLRWTVDPKDWSRPGTDTIVARVLEQTRPGGVVLVHDGGGDRRQTVDALRVLLPQLLRAGYRLGLPPLA